MGMKAEQMNLDFRNRQQRKDDLRTRIAQEKEARTFSFDSLTEEEKTFYLEIAEEDREGDQANYDGRGIRVKRYGR